MFIKPAHAEITARKIIKILPLKTFKYIITIHVSPTRCWKT